MVKKKGEWQWAFNASFIFHHHYQGLDFNSGMSLSKMKSNKHFVAGGPTLPPHFRELVQCAAFASLLHAWVSSPELTHAHIYLQVMPRAHMAGSMHYSCSKLYTWAGSPAPGYGQGQMWLLSNSWTSGQAKCKTRKPQGMFLMSLGRPTARHQGPVTWRWTEPMVWPGHPEELCVCVPQSGQSSSWSWTAALGFLANTDADTWFSANPFAIVKACEQKWADPCLCFHHMGDGRNEPKHYFICFLWGGESLAESHAWI